LGELLAMRLAPARHQDPDEVGVDLAAAMRASDGDAGHHRLNAVRQLDDRHRAIAVMLRDFWFEGLIPWLLRAFSKCS